MFSFLKKLISVLVVLWLVAMILNLKIGGRPTREWTQRVWQSEGVQKVYTAVRDRIVALIRKDISVEEVFKSELPKQAPSQEKPSTAPQEKSETKTIDLDKLDEKDRQALDRILQKSSP